MRHKYIWNIFIVRNICFSFLTFLYNTSLTKSNLCFTMLHFLNLYVLRYYTKIFILTFIQYLSQLQESKVLGKNPFFKLGDLLIPLYTFTYILYFSKYLITSIQTEHCTRVERPEEIVYFPSKLILLFLHFLYT